VVDYQLLGKLGDRRTDETRFTEARPSQSVQEAQSEGARGKTGPDELQAIKDLLIRKDLELEALKDEVTTLRRRLADQDAALDLLKKKKQAR
jgi:hypothetical protein